MKRRHIALIPTMNQWIFAVASGDTAEASLLKTGCFTRDPQRTLADQLGEVFEPLQITDRLACVLPPQSALLRWLEFPFNEPRKIAAAAPPEMACQVPQNLDDRVIYHEILGSGKVLTAALLKVQIEEQLQQFDDNREPLGYLGLSPFCYIDGLDWPVDSLLLCVETESISISRIENAKVTDLRILHRSDDLSASSIVQQALILSRCADTQILRIRLLGIDAEDNLACSLKGAGFETEPVRLSTENGAVSTEFLPAACLARTATKLSSTSLNLRSGAYKLKNDWQVLKRRIWIASGLLLLSILAICGSGYLQYQQQSAELESIQLQMKSLYQKQFPGEKLHVSAPLQLQSKLQEIQKKKLLFGSGSPGALQVLLAVSKNIDNDLTLDITEYIQNEEGLRLTGSTKSFDAVSRLLASLQQEALFSEVRILDSKQAIDASRVDFQLQIFLAQREGI